MKKRSTENVDRVIERKRKAETEAEIELGRQKCQRELLAEITALAMKIEIYIDKSPK